MGIKPEEIPAILSSQIADFGSEVECRGPVGCDGAHAIGVIRDQPDAGVVQTQVGAREDIGLETAFEQQIDDGLVHLGAS